MLTDGCTLHEKAVVKNTKADMSVYDESKIMFFTLNLQCIFVVDLINWFAQLK